MFENMIFTTEMFEDAGKYWLNKLSGELTQLNFLGDYSRADQYAGANYKLSFGNQIAKELLRMSRDNTLLLNVTLLTVFKILLYKFTGQNDIIVSSPVLKNSNQNYNKWIALRDFLSPGMTFRDLLMEVKQTVAEGYKKQYYPIRKLIKLLKIEDSLSLFKFILLLDNIHEKGLVVDIINNFENDMIFSINKNDEGLEGEIIYNSKLFKKQTIQRLFDCYIRILSGVLTDKNIRLSDINIITTEEKKKILVNFNNTGTEYPEDKTIPQLFEEQANRKNSNAAIVEINNPGSDCVRCITYGELNERANQLAIQLRNRGAGPGPIIGLNIGRSVEMLVGLLGILKAGGVYLPIDPDYPGDRITYMLKDSRANILLMKGDLPGKCEGIAFAGEIMDVSYESLAVENKSRRKRCLLESKGVPDNPAYVMYTSGSTGKSKGVVVEHKSVIRLVKNTNIINFSGEDRLLPTGALAFDISTFEIWGPLLNGIPLYLAEEDEILDAEKLGKTLAENEITIIHLIPQLFNRLAAQRIDIFSGLKYLLVGGDVVKPTYINKVRNKFRDLKILHMYGPTENTTFTTFFLVDKECEDKIPIGIPVSNSTVYILDKCDNLQPIGVVGELSTGGDGLARGYLNNPELTCEKFKISGTLRADLNAFGETNKNEKAPGNNVYMSYMSHLSYIYKTGDFARWLPDGNIEFLGRIDNQVKINGVRIELGEIENQLLKHDGIKDAVVITKPGITASEAPDGKENNYLCAYIVSDKQLSTTQLREFLLDKLPGYMMPLYFVSLKELLLTPNGKIDRKSLPDPVEMSPGINVNYEAPRNAVEKKLVDTWQQVLGREHLGINDDFFMNGGNSIKAIQIAARMKNAGYKVEVKEIFRNPTAAKLAPLVREVRRLADQSPITGMIPLTPIQKLFFRENGKNPNHFNQAVMLYSEKGFKEDAITEIFKKIQDHHDALRMSYKKENDGIVQLIHQPDYPISLNVYDSREQEHPGAALKNKTAEIQASIDIETGPLMKLAIFHMDDGDRLLIVIHHLVIDGLSWRILFEDLGTLDKQFEKGEILALPLKTDSFKTWSEKLVKYSTSESLLNQIPFWKGMETKKVSRIKSDFDVTDKLIKDLEIMSFNLDEEDTRRLLTGVNHAFGTEINDILLTALGLALKKSFGIENLAILLEGHGREDISEDIDVSRTLGWFTSLYPLILDFSYTYDISRQIKEVKETLRRVPDKGIGYGVLEYLTPGEMKQGLEFNLEPQVTFNYLGEFDADVKQMPFQIAQESVGSTEGENIKVEFDLEILGIIINNRLSITIRFNRNQFNTGTIEELLNFYQRELHSIILYCSGREERVLTPADLTYKALSIETLDRLCTQYAVEDIYPLAPMQEGMLFHALYDPASTIYLDQTSYRIYKEIDPLVVKKSLEELLKRHDALCTVFVHEMIDSPVQVVLKDQEREIGMYYEDISGIGGREKKEDFIHSLKNKNRQCLFDLNSDVLIRLAVIRIDEAEYEFIWSSPHIIMDGWSKTILISEYFEIYNSFRFGRRFQLPPAQSYGTYIKWLENLDKDWMKQYWKEYLDGYDTPVGVPEMRSSGSRENMYRDEEVGTVLKVEKLNRLKEFSAKNQTTLNILFQTIWAIILGRYNEKQDVVFGVVVSGRPSEIVGVESIVGLFINTIPVRIRWDEQTKFIDLMHIVRDDALKTEPYHSFPLVEIQARSALKQNLLNHIFIFENYPVAPFIESENVTINEEFAGFSDYHFNVVIEPGDQFKIKLGYNAEIYDREFVEELSDQIDCMVDQILKDSCIRIKDLQLSTGMLAVNVNILRQDEGDFQF